MGVLTFPYEIFHAKKLSKISLGDGSQSNIQGVIYSPSSLAKTENKWGTQTDLKQEHGVKKQKLTILKNKAVELTSKYKNEFLEWKRQNKLIRN